MTTITRYIVIYCKIYSLMITISGWLHDQKKGLPSTVLRNDLVNIQTQFNDINQTLKIICYVSLELIYYNIYQPERIQTMSS
jgi:hypothetical protein